MQEVLWSLPYTCTENMPGILNICIGMPVMIKKNIATECGVTNGAEAKVVGWKTKPLTGTQHLMLDTLFVELTSPPRPIQLEGLPPNVIPITRQPCDISCSMPNGKLVKIWRDQVPVVPNFAMTDYASQGRTRPVNPVDLMACENHHSYYTCLSQGTSASGTILLSGYARKRITEGPPPRQRRLMTAILSACNKVHVSNTPRIRPFPLACPRSYTLVIAAPSRSFPVPLLLRAASDAMFFA